MHLRTSALGRAGALIVRRPLLRGAPLFGCAYRLKRQSFFAQLQEFKRAPARAEGRELRVNQADWRTADREDERTAVQIIADVKIGFAQWQMARLHHLSVSGFRMGPMRQGAGGSEVRIRIPGLEPLTAAVRWRNKTGLGCEFARPLNPYVLDHILRVVSSPYLRERMRKQCTRC